MNHANGFGELAKLSLYASAGMFWQLLWPLVLGFALSSIVQAFVPKDRVAALLGKPGPRQLGLASFFGAVSSSCSYAAAAMARTLFRKGAHIVTALGFMVASTNLVFELSAALWTLLGWQFVVAEFIGGLLLVAILAILMLALAPIAAFDKMRGSDRNESEETEEAPADPRTLEGWRTVARTFVSEWRMLYKDIALGVFASGVLMVFVPDRFWQTLFLQSGGATGDSSTALQLVENALVGPLVAVASFACSIGNIPVAAVLYRGGITFGGALALIYADLLIIPLVLVYRRYYGWRLALWITSLLYVSIVVTSIIVDLAFKTAGLVPDRAGIEAAAHVDPFTDPALFRLNLVALMVAAALVWFAKSGQSTSKSAGNCCH